MHTIPTCLHTCVHTHGYGPFWSPGYLYSPTHALSSPHTPTHQKTQVSLLAFFFLLTGFGENLQKPKTCPRGTGVKNQVGWQWEHVIGRAKTWAQGRPVPAGVGLPCAGHSCPKAHILGGLLPLGRSQTSSICQMVAPWCLLIPLQLPLPKKLGGRGGER